MEKILVVWYSISVLPFLMLMLMRLHDVTPCPIRFNGNSYYIISSVSSLIDYWIILH